MTEVDVAVVGAGPAGMAAAAESARMGASVVLIDEQREPGGQYLRRPAPELRGSRGRTPRDAMRDYLLAGIAGIGTLFETTVWRINVGDAIELGLYQADRSFAVRAKAVVLATGAYDRPVAFPGWTLPGVMTAGAAQTLIKGFGVLPGRRVVLAGAGPFLLTVAEHLLDAGATIVALVEATPLQDLLRGIPALPGNLARLQEGLHYLTKLRSRMVPYLRASIVTRADGDASGVREVTIARADRDWRPQRGTERRLVADALCIGYGFIASTELARLTGCEVLYQPEAGGLVPWHADDLETSVPGVFVAGEAAGIGGAFVAVAEGRIAGVGAARRAGRPATRASEETLRQARARRASGRRWAAFLNAAFAPRPGLYELSQPDTILCRCEEIDRATIVEASTPWAATANAVKAVTRAGMGLCQGRICELLVCHAVSAAVGRSVPEVGFFTIRPPLKPVPLGLVADEPAPLDSSGV